MPPDVKRKYSSPTRQEQARRTRSRILEAARGLFARHGYGATTMQAVADEAGVAIQTVYWAFGTKVGVLWALLETTVAGDDDAVSVLERFRSQLTDDDDPDQRLRTVVRLGGRLMERSLDVHHILRGAAATDPELAETLAEAEKRRYEDATSLIDLIAGSQGLAEHLDQSTAADIFYALTSYETYEALVVTRKWPHQRWEQWTHQTLARLLLR